MQAVARNRVKAWGAADDDGDGDGGDDDHDDHENT